MSINTDLLASAWVWWGLLAYSLCSIAAWMIYARCRPASFSLVTDVFCLFFLTLWGPAMIVCCFLRFPAGMQPAYSGLGDPRIVFWTLVILSVGILSVAVGFALTEAIRSTRSGAAPSTSRAAPRTCFLVGAIYCAAFAALILALPDGRYFLTSAQEVLHGTSYDDYAFLRRHAMSDSFLFSDIAARMRFSSNAFMFTLACVGMIRWGGLPLTFVTMMPFVVFLVCSISKAPYVYYAIYPLVGYVIMQSLRVRIDWFIIRRLATFGIIAFSLLVGLYLVQYGRSDSGDITVVTAATTALYRVFGAGVDALQMYLSAYPDRFDFGLGVGFGFIAAGLGQPMRDYAHEIVALAGADLVGDTTYPTIFFGGAYAELGVVGVILYSFVVGAYLSIAQRLVVRLKVLEIRTACLTTLCMNLSFLLILPAPTSLVSYGVGSIPLMAFLLDCAVRMAKSPINISAPRAHGVAQHHT